MNERFRVGEVVICVAASPPPDVAKYVGEELTITGPLERVACITGGLAYSVTHRDGNEMWAAPFALRKKRPPREQTCEWSDIPWFEPRGLVREAE